MKQVKVKVIDSDGWMYDNGNGLKIYRAGETVECSESSYRSATEGGVKLEIVTEKK